MTIANTSTRVKYDGDGSNVNFTIPFAYLSGEVDNIKVILIQNDGTEVTQTNPTHWAFDDATDPTRVEFVTAPAADEKVLVYRDTTKNQETDLPTADDVIESQLDRLTIMTQELEEQLNRTIKFVRSSDSSDKTMPEPDEGKFLSWSSGELANTSLPTNDEISNAQGYAEDALASSVLSQDWATKTDGLVESTDNSSKAYAIGGTGVTDTSGKGAAKEWATKTSGTVDTAEYSAKEYAQGTQNRGTSGGGSAKDWATYVGGTVDDTEFSAKEYANQAASSAASAAAQLASAFFSDAIFYTSADSPVTFTSSDNGKLHVFDSSGGAITVNLPEISSVTTPYNVAALCTTAGNDITFNRGGSSDTIQGSTTKILNVANTGFQMIADTDPTPDVWSVLEFGSVGDGTVTTAKIADANVTTAKIADSNITAPKIASSAVTTAKINDEAVTRAKLADGAIATSNIGSKTTTYTITLDDDVLFGDSSGGAFTMTLPAESSADGRIYTISKTSSDFNAITINNNGASSEAKLHTQGETVKLISDGTSWHIIDRFIPSTWTSYTPGTQGLGTITVQHSEYKRVGDSIMVQVQFVTGTTSAAEAQVDLPSGLSVGSYSSPIQDVGKVTHAAGNDTEYTCLATSSDTFFNFGLRAPGTSSAYSPQNGNAIFGSSLAVTINATVKISGWEG